MLKQLTIFGDSLLKGVVLNPQNRRYRVAKEFDLEATAQKRGVSLVNLSHFGSTIEKGMAAVERWLDKGPDCDAVVIEFGGNDSNFQWAEVAAEPTCEHLPATPLPRFQQLYQQLLHILKQHNISPVLVNLPPLCADRYLNWITRDGLDKSRILQWLGDVNAIYRYQERYSRTIDRLAFENNCPCLDLRGAFLARLHIHDLYCEDGIHPNENGQKLMLRTFEKFLTGAGCGTQLGIRN
ncbi:MAG: SGNH/GDSL hydrolase family protein [Clostridia bacterium]|nr:SGNH/GDSL hydrolase family protein [Clostridia bacterium]